MALATIALRRSRCGGDETSAEGTVVRRGMKQPPVEPAHGPPPAVRSRDGAGYASARSAMAADRQAARGMRARRHAVRENGARGEGEVRQGGSDGEVRRNANARSTREGIGDRRDRLTSCGKDERGLCTTRARSPSSLVNSRGGGGRCDATRLYERGSSPALEDPDGFRECADRRDRGGQRLLKRAEGGRRDLGERWIRTDRAQRPDDGNVVAGSTCGAAERRRPRASTYAGIGGTRKRKVIGREVTGRVVRSGERR